jgi:hypothetical protein
MKKIKTTILFAMLPVILFFCSCKKKDNSTASSIPIPKGDLYFHLHTNIDIAEADSGIAYRDANGRKIQLNIAAFYISGIVLKKPDGTNYSLNGVCVLKTIAQGVFMLASVPAGNYSSVSFNVGIDATTNQNSPSSYSSGVLAMQNPNMWFGSVAQGYIFMNVQGLVDTASASNGIANYPFSYQLGTSGMLKAVNLPSQAFSVVANQSTVVHIVADYGKLLQGINFNTQNTATPFNNETTATQIANNITTMFH